ncbi:unnamed protein product, partial [Brassica rapa subsp. narinosa]
ISRSVENTERKRKAGIDQLDQTAVEERFQFPTFDGLDLLRWTRP